jgi:hypothetical protein
MKYAFDSSPHLRLDDNSVDLTQQSFDRIRAVAEIASLHSLLMSAHPLVDTVQLATPLRRHSATLPLACLLCPLAVNGIPLEAIARFSLICEQIFMFYRKYWAKQIISV